MRALSRCLILICLVLVQSAFAQNHPQFLQFQSDVALLNPVIKRSLEPVGLEALQIPLSKLHGIAAVSVEELPSFLIEEKSGEVYFNWILNPEDKTYGPALEKILKEKGISFSRITWGQGWASSSRSYFLYDPVLKKYFSFKTSTDRVAQNKMDKKWNSGEAVDAVLISKYLKSIRFKNIEIIPDVFSVATGNTQNDLGWSLRDLGIVTLEDGTSLVPFYALFDPEFQKEILKAHNEVDMFNLMKKTVIPIVAEGMAEFIAETGLILGWAHTQNLFLKRDKNGKAKKLVVWDTGDVFVLNEIARVTKGFPQLSQTAMLEKQFKNWFDIFDQIPIQNFYNYNGGEKDIGILVDTYYNLFNPAFAKRTGVLLSYTRPKIEWGQRHFENNVQFHDGNWAQAWIQKKLSRSCKKLVVTP